MKKNLIMFCLAVGMGAAAPLPAAVPDYDAQAALESARGDVANWMSYLPDEVYVAHVSIPGTHDAATGHEWDSSLGKSMSTTQCTTLTEQLEGGIRAFDFRPGLKSNTDYLVCAHGTTYLKLRLDEAFRTLTEYLDKHPKEFFVIHLFRGNIYRAGDGSSTDAQRNQYNELMGAIFNEGDLSDYFIDYSPDLKVADIRGKIVVFRRDRIDFVHIAKAGNLTNWPSDKELWTKDNYATAVNATYPSIRGDIYVSDISSPKKDELELELNSISGLYRFSSTQPTPNEARANGIYKPFWVMNFTSGEYNGSGTKAYLQNAIETNPYFTTLINDSDVKGPAGIVFSDWVLADKHTYSNVEYDIKGVDLVKAIIENNFAYIDRFILDSELFQPIEGANNWDDTKQYFVKNKGTGLLLSSGATWGTHAVAGKYGIRVTPCYDKFTDTYVLATTQGNGYVGTDGDKTFFVDYAPATVFKVDRVSDAGDVYTFTLTLDGKELAMTAEAVNTWIDGTNYMVEPRALGDDDPMQQWELIETGAYLASLVEEREPGTEVDLTDYIPGHHFWPNDKNNWTGATDTYCSISAEGVDNWNDKDLLLHCHNKKTTSATLASRTRWPLEKSFTSLPAGLYRLSFNAAEYNLNDKEGFSFLVNGEELKSKIAAATSASAADAIASFRNEADQYTVTHNFELKDGEQLVLSATNGEVLGTEACLFLDNFKLDYLGKKDESGVDDVYAPVSSTVDVYNISGVIVGKAVERDNALDGLAPGVYIIKGGAEVTKVLKQ